MLELVLPPGTAAAESRQDLPDADLFPEEEAAVGRAVVKRRREFATGRHCARRALADLGVAAGPIGVGPKGEPRWPRGVVGSITHCDGFRGCAVAAGDELATIGIDAEPNLHLPDRLLGDIARAEEVAHLTELGALAPGVCWDRLLFCIKEAVYKAWFPLVESWLDFEDATVTIDASRRDFEARLLVEGPRLAGERLDRFRGRWAAADGLLLAAVTLPAR